MSDLEGGAAQREPQVTVMGEHIERYGPLKGGLVFLDPVPAISRRSTRTTPGSSLKDGKSGICDMADDHDLVCLNDVFKPPVVRQWLHNGRLYREKEERQPSRFELIFDLIIVGIVHQLADVASEEVSGLSLLRIILTFYPAWSIWCDYRNWQNMSGVDDVSQRMQTLAILICLIGYSVNASAIELHAPEAVASTTEAVSSGAAAVVETAHRLLRRAASAATESTSTGQAVGAELAHGDGQQHAIIAAIVFFLVAKLIRILTYLAYAWDMPDFRPTFLARVAGLTVTSLLFMGCIWAPTLKATAILAAVGAIVEIGLRFSVGIVATMVRRRYLAELKAKADAGESVDFLHISAPRAVGMIPAINLEHMVERTAAFITIIIGESVIAVLFIAVPGTYGLSKQFARAVFGVSTAFCINAVYFDAALSKKFLHAIRRHWFTHQVWDVTHLPLGVSLILASAALPKLVQNQEAPQGVRWQYGGGVATSLLCITILGVMHQSLDPRGTSRASAVVRACIRLSVAIIFVLLPLIERISDLAFLGIYVGIISFMVILEVYLKLGRQVFDPEEEGDHRPVEDELDARLDYEAEQESRRNRQSSEFPRQGNEPDGVEVDSKRSA